MPITTSAPGKLMLFGEHAVIYNKPCLVTAVDFRYNTTIQFEKTATIEISTPHLNAKNERQLIPLTQAAHFKGTRPETTFVEAAIARFASRTSLHTGLKITTSGAKSSYGLGSSSAITVATMKALATLFDHPLSLRELFDLSFQAVLDVQGVASGFDVAAAVYGGTLFYSQRGAVIEPLTVPTLPFIVVYSGAKVGTVNLVKQVARTHQQHPTLLDNLFQLMADITTEAHQELQQPTCDWPKIGTLMDLNQGLLTALNVSTSTLSHLLHTAKENGALGAKLSGAGGGDCLFVLPTAANSHHLKKHLTQAGGYIVPFPLNAPGVRVEPAYSPKTNAPQSAAPDHQPDK